MMAKLTRSVIFTQSHIDLFNVPLQDLIPTLQQHLDNSPVGSKVYVEQVYVDYEYCEYYVTVERDETDEEMSVRIADMMTKETKRQAKMLKTKQARLNKLTSNIDETTEILRQLMEAKKQVEDDMK